MYPANSKLPKGWAKPMKDKNKIDVYDVLAKTHLTVGQVAWLVSAFIENPDGHGFSLDDADVSVSIDSVLLTKCTDTSECAALTVRVLFFDPETDEIKIKELLFEQDNCYEGFDLDEDEIKWYDEGELV